MILFNVPRNNGYVTQMVVDTINNYLYIAGSFTKAGNINVQYVTKWDGVKWYYLGNPPTCCLSMAIYRGKLFIGSAPGSNPYVPPLASWDGTQWLSIDGPNNIIKSLCVFQDELYVGGYFDKVDTGNDYLQVNYIARYWEPPSSIEEVNKSNHEKYLGNPVPNPATGTVNIPYYIPYKSNSLLTVRTLKGDLLKEILLLEGHNTLELPLNNFSKGIYLCSILIDGQLRGMKRLAVE